jgi:hypothetical protein
MVVTGERENLYLRRDIPDLRGLHRLNAYHHGKVPAYSSVYILLYEEWTVFVLETYLKTIAGFAACPIINFAATRACRLKIVVPVK